MALSTKTGFFNTTTAAAGNTVAETGVGFTPKVLLLWWNGRTDTVDAAGAGNHQRGFGVCTGATSRWAMTSLSQDNVTDAVSNKAQTNANCIILTTTSDAVDGLMDLQSFDADGFTMVIDD